MQGNDDADDGAQRLLKKLSRAGQSKTNTPPKVVIDLELAVANISVTNRNMDQKGPPSSSPPPQEHEVDAKLSFKR